MICIVAACLWSLVLLVPVLSRHGWPANHEGTAPVARAAAVLGQWKVGHPLPVWSTAQQFGHGSPMPALYHKTFSYVSAAVLWLSGGKAKPALVLPVLLFMVLAFGGTVVCLREVMVGRYPWLWLTGGATLVASNYATTDWLVRGAFAELAAFALIPWLYAGCILLLRQGRLPLWIGPLMALLALSHSSLALFALLPLGLAGGLAVMRWGWRHTRGWLGPGAWSAAAALVIAVPFLLPLWAMGNFSRINRLTAGADMRPRTNQVDVVRYFWDANWTWGADWTGFTVQLDTACLLVLPMYVLLLLVPRWRKAPGAGSGDEPDASGWIGAFLLGTIGVMAWLQTSSAFWVYELLPGTAYLQFAWRLLAFLTPAVVICACIASGWVASWEPRVPWAGASAAGVLAALMLITTAYPKMWWNRLKYPFIPAAELQAVARQETDYAAFGEFLPQVDWPRAEPGLLGPVRQAEAFLARPLGQPCEVTTVDPPQPSGERRISEWRIDCPQAAVARLPFFLAPGMKAQVRTGDPARWATTDGSRSCTDPRLHLMLGAGISQVRVRFPDWSGTVRAGFERPQFDFQRDCIGARERDASDAR